MDEHFLRVMTNGTVVGQLGHNAREMQYSFQYEQAWRDSREAFSLSPHILHTGEPPVPGAVHRFLENLLPEGRALEVASYVNNVTKTNVYGLVRALGAEPVGAFSFLPLDAHTAQAEAIRRAIPLEELSARIKERDTVPFPVWDQKVRLSVAGFQDKLQVMVEGERISLVDGRLSSTHLLKPESRSPHSPFLVANEHFCMSLARAINLPTAAVEIRRIPEPILLIERFDRIVRYASANDPSSIHSVDRVHVIDGCQALDVPSGLKYERNFGHNKGVANIRDGVSFEKLFALEKHFENPAATKSFMLRWAIFQLLIGNSDAHGKNLSFFQRRTRLAPAPMYDLVCINVYGDGGKVEQEMAMAYGDVFLLDEITPYALADFCSRIKMPPALVAREMKRLADVVCKFARVRAESPVYVGEERAMVKRIADFVCRQGERLMRLAPEVPKVAPELLRERR
ncbi:HipA domain-containing protein [Paraburkholderia sacchari]|uniref:Type II toxin-antitoxin system HipA family toxin n=1 Tax=Paraburkholderia sacchari TaxID=159450 RepID=A0A8T6ZA83_9BURK|nr:HipA domain-containing protein [Paraburkholderia sacchari]NLP60519.1 type II toxin-antitoxin system HipA family toxin [Paraburkholderia sacchari]